MSKTYAQAIAEDRRLTLLKGLEGAAGYRTNAYVLRRFCERLGHTMSADTAVADLAWLAEQGLATTEVADGVTIATLTERGLDVATGRALCPGVARPQPE